jgi:hypothetical protein
MVSTDPNANTEIHDLGYPHIYGQNRSDIPIFSMLTFNFVFSTSIGFRKTQVLTIVGMHGRTY